MKANRLNKKNGVVVKIEHTAIEIKTNTDKYLPNSNQ